MLYVEKCLRKNACNDEAKRNICWRKKICFCVTTFYLKIAPLKLRKKYNRDTCSVAMPNYLGRITLGEKEERCERKDRAIPLFSFWKVIETPWSSAKLRDRDWLEFASARSASRSASRRSSSASLEVHSKRRRKMLHLLSCEGGGRLFGKREREIGHSWFSFPQWRVESAPG